MIHSTRPIAARKKWVKTTPGENRLCCPASRRRPPRAIQVPSNTNPPPAVTSQVMSAATSIRTVLSCLGAVAVGLLGLIDNAHAVAVGELSSEPSGHAQSGERHDGQNEPPDGGAVGVAELAVPSQQL